MLKKFDVKEIQSKRNSKTGAELGNKFELMMLGYKNIKPCWFEVIVELRFTLKWS